MASRILGAVTEKLTGVANYAEWKYQMENFMLLNDLWQFMDESVIFDKNDAKKVVAVGAKCRIALGFIKLSIGGNLILNVKDAQTPKEAWTAITSLFEHKNDARALTLRNQLYNIKLQGSMMDHLQQVKVIQDQLSNIGQKVADAELITSVLRRLSASYERFIISLTVDDRLTNLKFSDLEGLLLQ
eukprot:Gb_25941 [translate_table: standard]